MVVVMSSSIRTILIKRRILKKVIDYFRTDFRYTMVWELLRLISDAYENKSRGRADNLGNMWEPLAPSTIARKLRDRGIGGFSSREGHRPSLSDREDKQWRAIYSRELARLAAIVGLADAKPMAAKLAWNIMKRKGARTSADLVKSNAHLVPILVETGRLLDSFQPGTVTSSGYIPSNADQLYEVRGNTYTIGSKVPYHADVAKVRPVIPANHSAWVNEAISKALEHLPK